MSEQLHLTHRADYLQGMTDGQNNARAGLGYAPRGGDSEAHHAYSLGYTDGWTEADPCGNATCDHLAHTQPETHVVGRTVLARFNPEDRSFAAPASWLGVAIRSTDRWEVLAINDTGAAVIRQFAEPRTVASIYPGQYRMA